MAKKSVNLRIGWDMKAFSTSSQNLSRSLKSTGKKMQSVGKSMSMSLTAPIVGLGGLAVKTFADFQQSMAKVQAISGATGDDFLALTKTAKDLGISTRFAASEVSELMLNYSKLGFSSDEIQKITGATLDLALATGEDLARSAEVAGSTLRAFGLDATEMVHLTDVMANSFSSSALDLDSFAESMKYVAPISKAAGVSLEETSAMLSLLANSGIKGSQAGTALKKIISEIGASGKPTNVALKELAATGLNLADAEGEVGDRAKAALLILADGAAQIDPLTEAYRTQSNVAKEMAGIMDDTLEGSMMKLKSATEGLGISFGEVMAPAISSAAETLSSIAIKFSNLSEGTKKTIVVIASLVAGIGPLIFAVGALTTAFAFLAANPIILIITGIILAIAGLVAVFIYVKNNAQAFADFFYNLWVKIANGFIDSVKFIIQGHLKLAEMLGLDIGSGVNAWLDSFKLTARESKKEFQTLGEAFEDVKKTIGGALPTPDPVKVPKAPTTDTDTGEGEKDLTENQQKKRIGKLKQELFEVNTIIKKIGETPILPVVNVEAIKTSLGKVAEDSVHIFAQIGRKMGAALSTGLKDLATEGLASLGSFIGDSLTANTMMEDQLKQTENHYNKMIQAAQGNADEISRIEQEKQAKVAEIQESFSFDNRVQDFGRGLLDSIGKFMGQFGEAMIALGIAESALGKAIALGPAGAPLAIIGGVALVAAGAAISSLSKKGMGSGSTSTSTSPAPSYSNSGGQNGYQNIFSTKISGRDLIIVQERESSFKR